MEGLKNIIVLKNLPSNIIDEAIVVVKPSVKIEGDFSGHSKFNNHNYVVKEAEGIIKNYLKNVEEVKEKNRVKTIENKYKKLKKITTVLSIALLVAAVIIVI